MLLEQVERRSLGLILELHVKQALACCQHQGGRVKLQSLGNLVFHFQVHHVIQDITTNNTVSSSNNQSPKIPPYPFPSPFTCKEASPQLPNLSAWKRHPWLSQKEKKKAEKGSPCLSPLDM